MSAIPAWSPTIRVRVLGRADLDDFLALTAADPVVNVFAEHRARSTYLDPQWLGGEVWGLEERGRLVAACHAAANLVPVECTPEQAREFARHALRRPRAASTVVGPADAVEAMWEVLEPAWGPARELRTRQPHLVLDAPPAVAPDPGVTVSQRADLAAIYPACVAMYCEEVGVSPESGDGGELYRARVAQLIARGWSFARVEDGRVTFKAEVACVSPYAAQVQGVFVPPDLRGQGRATSGMAAVVAQVRRDIAPVVSLYVNDYNHAARAVYERVGFRETARFTTVLLT